MYNDPVAEAKTRVDIAKVGVDIAKVGVDIAKVGVNIAKTRVEIAMPHLLYAVHLVRHLAQTRRYSEKQDVAGVKPGHRERPSI